MGQEQVLIARLGAPYGLKGGIKVYSYTKPPEAAIKCCNWLIKASAGPLVIAKPQLKAHGKGFILFLPNQPAREVVQSFTNAEVWADISAFPALAEGEHYQHDLIGFNVYNAEGFYFGALTNLYATGANDVMEVIDKEKRYLIPYVKDIYVLSVAIETKVITVDWQPDYN